MPHISDKLWEEISTSSGNICRFRERLDEIVEFSLSENPVRIGLKSSAAAANDIADIYNLSSELYKKLTSLSADGERFLVRNIDKNYTLSFIDHKALISDDIDFNQYFYTELKACALPILVAMAKNALRRTDQERPKERLRQKTQRSILKTAVHDIDKYYFVFTGSYIKRGKFTDVFWISKILNIICRSATFESSNTLVKDQISWRNNIIKNRGGSAPPAWDFHRESELRKLR